MGSPLSEYNKKLIERLQRIKDNARLSNEQIAEFMDCDARHVSRILNGSAKATCEDIANLAEKLPADIDYLLYGKRSAITKIAQYWAGADENELAELHMEIAKFLNTRANIMHKKAEPQADFVIGKNTILETYRKK